MNSQSGQSASAQDEKLPRLILILILALSAFVQLTVFSRSTVEHPLRNDAGDYFSYAYNLAHHGVYSLDRSWEKESTSQAPVPDASRPPGYPLFLAMVASPDPPDAFLRRIALLQAVLGIVSVWFVYLISARFLGPYWSLGAALVTALSPHLAVINTYLLTEPLFGFLLLASILTSLRAIDAPNRWRYAVAGALWGLCSLVRPTTQFLPVLLLVGIVALPRLRKFTQSGIVGFICFAAVLAPWTIHSQQIKESETESSLMVRALAHGSYPGFTYEGERHTFGYPYRYDPHIARITHDLPSVLKHIAHKFKAQPLTYTQWYLIGKPKFLLSWADPQGSDIFIYSQTHTPYYEDVKFVIVRKLAFALHWPLMILGLVGALLCWLRPEWLRLGPSATLAARGVAFVVAYALVFHMIVAPFPRYGIPFRSLLYALAMVPLRAVWLKLRTPQAVLLY